MDFQKQVEQKGSEIFKLMQSQSTSVLDKDWWYERIMQWSMKNESFKTQMFRFVDVLPVLTTDSEVVSYFKEYLSQKDGNLPSIFNFGMGIGSLAPFLMAKVIRKNITQIAKIFIAGKIMKDILPQLTKSRLKKMTFSINLLSEETLNEKEALDYQDRCIELIHQLSSASQSWDYDRQIDIDGTYPKVNISVRLSAIYSQIKLTAWEHTKSILKTRLRHILQVAKEKNVFVNMDMEHYHIKNLTLEVFKELVMEPEFKDYPHLGIVIQAYLRDSYEDLTQLLKLAHKRGVPFTIRVVKGAYWDYEVIVAEQENWPCPVYLQKRETDINFERCVKLLIDHQQDIKIAIGSHNIRSIASSLIYAQNNNFSNIEFQMLFGMAEPLKSALVQMGMRIREYVPVGELIPGMAYLVRRLLENSANESFLHLMQLDSQNLSKDLLIDPLEDVKDKSLIDKSLEGSKSSNKQSSTMFTNEPLLDFSLEVHRTKFQEAFDRQKKLKRPIYQIVIGNKSIKTDRKLLSINPSSGKALGEVYVASQKEAEMAVKQARGAFLDWKAKSVAYRSDLVKKLALLISQNRYDLAALQVLEVGKPWQEADGDITEAIDFCNFYAMHAEKLDKGYWVGGVAGETTHYRYNPRGIVTVISPWNFPLAILTGMVSAAVVTGNTVIMKPAEQSSIVAAILMQMIQKVGFPKGVVNFLPGYGEEIGDYLVCHKDVNLIAFTGSRDVGLGIVKKTAHTFEDQYAVKKSIIEMGGKNAIIVDNSADWDEAISGVLYSAFGFAGQKCSACSRVIVVDSIYDKFVSRLIEGVKDIAQKPADDPDAYLGPVIDKEAFDRIHQMIQKSSSPPVYQAEVKDLMQEGGYFIPPTVFTDVKPDDFLAQNEVFGPVLTVIKAKDLADAVKIANGTRYGLTGGIYSRSPKNIDYVKERLEVGNLYINRAITGAIVNRHPFGGLKQSGVGSKTGGPDYLLQFLEPVALIENTMRRGFAPRGENAERPLFQI